MTDILDVPTGTEGVSQTPAPATEPTGWMSPTGEFGQGAPEKIQGLIDDKKWSKVDQLADAYLELEQFKGIGEHLVIPNAEDAEGWDKVYNQLGRPEAHDKYELTYEGDVPISDELVGRFKEFAYGLGLTQKQFNEAVNFQLNDVGGQIKAYKEQAEQTVAEGVAALKQKWGEANYETKVKESRIVADQLGIYETLEAKGLASDPDIISMLDSLAGLAAEDTITPGAPPAPQKTMPQELEEIKESKAFMDKFHIDHKKTMQRFVEINQMIANSGQAPQRSR